MDEMPAPPHDGVWTPSSPAAAGSLRRHVLLLVDDDPAVLAALRRTFREEPLEVVTTDSPGAALKRLQGGTVSILGADYQMPEMSGIDLLKEARALSPCTPRILFTAFAGEPRVLWERSVGLFTLFAKPWQDPELRRIVRNHLRTAELEKAHLFRLGRLPGGGPQCRPSPPEKEERGFRREG